MAALEAVLQDVLLVHVSFVLFILVMSYIWKYPLMIAFGSEGVRYNIIYGENPPWIRCLNMKVHYFKFINNSETDCEFSQLN